MEIGDWVRAKGEIRGLPFRAYGKVIDIQTFDFEHVTNDAYHGSFQRNPDDALIKVQFPYEIIEVPQGIIEVVGNHECSPENVGRFLDWLENRGGVAVWNSANLSNPGATWSAPVNDEEGNVKGKRSWQAGKVIRIITDINDIDVVISKEIKRFHVATRQARNSMSIKVTDGGTRRIHAAVAKAEKEYGDAWYEFDYDDYENAVICVPDEKTPLSEWEVNSGSNLQLAV